MPKKNTAKPAAQTKGKTAEDRPDGTSGARPAKNDKSQRGEAPSKDFPIAGVGASAGGLEAFEQLLGALPGNVGLGLVLIPHLAPKHESIMSELLAKHCQLTVSEASDGTPVRPNQVYVIPPNRDIRIEKGVLHLSDLPDNHRMPIDHFLRSLAHDQQSRAIGVILSGTASDGTLGLQAIKSQGGITFAQDEKSAKYSGMPRSAVATGIVDFVLPPDLIARELVRIAHHVRLFAGPDGAPEDAAAVDENLSKVLAVLKSISRVDFSLYKPGTIRRRISRRMFLRKIETIEEYVRFLKTSNEEAQSLFDEVLINVTGFFRDPEAFEALKTAGFAALMSSKNGNSPVRAWVPGCSTGEEAYSLAISLLEFFGEAAHNTPIQVFATDVSESIIQRARAGVYPENIASDMTPGRLRRYFQKVDGGYLVSKAVRDMCVFAKQDLTRDPPFSRLDIISCRNVMIYMNQLLQKRIIPLFHYALNPGGILFLGSSETIGDFNEIFNGIDKKHRIYSKKPVAVPVNFQFVSPFTNQEELPSDGGGRHPSSNTAELQRVADQILLNRYAPASVVVNSNLDIVQFIGSTGPFLAPAPGDASLNLLKMVKAGLHLELRVAFQKMKQDGHVRREGLLVEHDGGFKNVNFEILPIRNLPGKERYHIVIFEDSPRQSAIHAKQKPENQSKGKQKKPAAADQELVRLTDELEATREYLQSIIEEQRTTNEELRSANEEIQSSNEELQSINEELETAKEELQSTNEELTTVNEELQNRNDELTLLNNDLNNLLSSVNIPIVMLGNDLRIRRFTPLAERLMNLIPTDIGRPITDITPNLKVPDLKQMITGVIDTLKIEDSEVEDLGGRWYSMRIRPYRTTDNKIDGVVIVLLDLPKNAKSRHEAHEPH